MSRKFFAFFLLLLLAVAVRGQVVTSYAIYDIPASARTAGLGMDFLAVDDVDLSLTLDNPSLIDARYHTRFGFNYVNLFDGANAGAAAVGYHNNTLGDFVFGLRFVTFGEFQGYDETETATGTFRASDYIFSIGWGRHIDSLFSLGVTLKPVLSQYEQYTSCAIALDVAATYRSPSRAFSATVIARSIGAQLSTYDNTVEDLPLHLDAGISYQLAQAPFRFYLQVADMQHWNLAYYDTLSPTTVYDAYTGTTTSQSGFSKFADNLFRHINVAVELCLGHKFFARAGYSYRQTQEMEASSRTNINFSGFSYGLGIRTKHLEFAYARNNYHLGQSPNYITLNFYF